MMNDSTTTAAAAVPPPPPPPRPPHQEHSSEDAGFHIQETKQVVVAVVEEEEEQERQHNNKSRILRMMKEDNNVPLDNSGNTTSSSTTGTTSQQDVLHVVDNCSFSNKAVDAVSSAVISEEANNTTFDALQQQQLEAAGETKTTTSTSQHAHEDTMEKLKDHRSSSFSSSSNSSSKNSKSKPRRRRSKNSSKPRRRKSSRERLRAIEQAVKDGSLSDMSIESLCSKDEDDDSDYEEYVEESQINNNEVSSSFPARTTVSPEGTPTPDIFEGPDDTVTDINVDENVVVATGSPKISIVKEKRQLDFITQSTNTSYDDDDEELEDDEIRVQLPKSAEVKATDSSTREVTIDTSYDDDDDDQAETNDADHNDDDDEFPSVQQQLPQSPADSSPSRKSASAATTAAVADSSSTTEVTIGTSCYDDDGQADQADNILKDDEEDEFRFQPPQSASPEAEEEEEAAAAAGDEDDEIRIQLPKQPLVSAAPTTGAVVLAATAADSSREVTTGTSRDDDDDQKKATDNSDDDGAEDDDDDDDDEGPSAVSIAYPPKRISSLTCPVFDDSLRRVVEEEEDYNKGEGEEDDDDDDVFPSTKVVLIGHIDSNRELVVAKQQKEQGVDENESKIGDPVVANKKPTSRVRVSELTLSSAPLHEDDVSKIGDGSSSALKLSEEGSSKKEDGSRESGIISSSGILSSKSKTTRGSIHFEESGEDGSSKRKSRKKPPTTTTNANARISTASYGSSANHSTTTSIYSSGGGGASGSSTPFDVNRTNNIPNIPGGSPFGESSGHHSRLSSSGTTSGGSAITKGGKRGTKRSSTISRASGVITYVAPVITAKRKTNSLSGMTIDKLKLDDHAIIGRSKEQQLLKQALEECTKKHHPELMVGGGNGVVGGQGTTNANIPNKQIIFVSGHQGTGKTSLARSTILRANAANKKSTLLFLESKFDIQLKHEPYAGIAAIGNTICDHILNLQFARNYGGATKKSHSDNNRLSAFSTMTTTTTTSSSQQQHQPQPNQNHKNSLLNQTTNIKAYNSIMNRTKSLRSFHIARAASSRSIHNTPTTRRKLKSTPGRVNVGTAIGGGGGGGGGTTTTKIKDQGNNNDTASDISFSQLMDTLVNELGPDLSVLYRLIPALEDLLDAAEFMSDDEKARISGGGSSALSKDDAVDDDDDFVVAKERTRFMRQQSMHLIQIDKKKMMLNGAQNNNKKSTSTFWTTGSEKSLDAKQRIQYAFCRFIKVCATYFRPLVVLLADLEYADIASFELLQLIMTDPDIQNLLVIGTYNISNTKGSNKNKMGSIVVEGNDDDLLLKMIQNLKRRSSSPSSFGIPHSSEFSSMDDLQLVEQPSLVRNSTQEMMPPPTTMARNTTLGGTIIPEYGEDMSDDDYDLDVNDGGSNDFMASPILAELSLPASPPSSSSPRSNRNSSNQSSFQSYSSFVKGTVRRSDPSVQNNNMSHNTISSRFSTAMSKASRISNITMESLRQESVMQLFSNHRHHHGNNNLNNMNIQNGGGTTADRAATAAARTTTIKTISSISSVTMSSEVLFKVREIEIGNLDMDGAEELVRHVLGNHSDLNGDDEISDLVRLCYKRTHGNPYFMKLFLKHLYDSKILVFNLGLFKWMWDLERIEEQTQATDNVVNLLTSKLNVLPSKSQVVLRLASCLGNTFQARILTIVYEAYRSGDDVSLSFRLDASTPFGQNADLQNVMNRLVQDGYLESSGYDAYVDEDYSDDSEYEDSSVTQQEQEHVEFSFTNDKIREAITKSMPDHDRKEIYYRVGEILVTKLDEDLLESTLFVVADLLNGGRPNPNVHEERMLLADFNRRAGRKAISFSAFEAAAEYSAKGIALLPQNYTAAMEKLDGYDLDLVLELYTIGTKAEAFMGNSIRVDLYSQKVISQKGLAMEFKLDVYTIWIDNLAYRGKMVEASKLALDLLSKFNCKFPKSKIGIMYNLGKAMMKVKGVLKSNKILDEYVFESMAVEVMDPARLKLLVVLDNLATILLNCRKKKYLLPLVTIRNLEWTMHYGVNEYSAVALATSSVLFTTHLGEFESGAKLAKSSLALYPRIGITHEARILTIIHGAVTHWTTRIRDNMKPLLHAYELGIRSGDTESAGLAFLAFIQLRWVSSFSLELAVTDLEAYTTQMKDFNRILLYDYGLLYWEVFENLLGCTTPTGEELPMELGGNRISHETIERFSEEDESQFCATLRTFQCILYCIYGKYEKCAEISLRYGHDEFMNTHPGLSVAYLEALTKGVSCYAAARATGKHKYRKDAKAIHHRVNQWLDKGNPNVKHYTHLLDAEKAALRGKKDAAIKLYQKAVVRSARSGLLLEAGLASERLAALYLEYSEKEDTQYEDAQYRLEDACRYYTDLGAHRKVRLLEETYHDLLQRA